MTAEIQALCMALERPIVFVDLETTGGSADSDRVTEIGVVEISRDGVSTWTTLVDPQQPIPVFIARLTGIDDAMVRDAPRFEQIAQELAARLEGKLFAAHNARFDYGFLKSEFRRAGITFSADVLCTVRLSRTLFPTEKRHGLDALIERHGLRPTGRHRALSDADLLWQFWQTLHQLHPASTIAAAVGQLVEGFSLPAALDAAILDSVPAAAGVYTFYGEGDAPLYVGKSRHLRRKVSAHFVREQRSARDTKLAKQVRRIAWSETGEALGAALLHAQRVRTLAPAYNRRARPGTSLCAWHYTPAMPAPRLVHARDRDFGATDHLFGLFMSRREAEATLREVARAARLCPVLLGLETPLRPGAPCSARATQMCDGACIDAALTALHADRTRAALAHLRLQPWPYRGPAWFALSGAATWHLIQNWHYLGSVDADRLGEPAALTALLPASPPDFEQETYLVLQAHLKEGQVRVQPCEPSPGADAI